MCHQNERVQYCQSCEEVFTDSFSDTHGQLELCKTSSETWICVTCGGHFKSALNLAKHLFGNPFHNQIDLSAQLRLSDTSSHNTPGRSQLQANINEANVDAQRVLADGVIRIDTENAVNRRLGEGNPSSESVRFEEVSEDCEDLEDRQDSRRSGEQESPQKEGILDLILEEGHREMYEQKDTNQYPDDEEELRGKREAALSELVVSFVLVAAFCRTN